MKRRLFNVAAMVSLLLCASTVALWVRTATTSDMLRYTRMKLANGSPPREFLRHGWVATSAASTIQLAHWRHDYTNREDASQLLNEPNTDWQLGFRWSTSGPIERMPEIYGRRREPRKISLSRDYSEGPFHRESAQVIVLPDWLVVVVTAALPAIAVARAVRRRPQSGHCRSRGYDMRATPDRCPECGTVPSSSPS